jgi:hypothetical protein
VLFHSAIACGDRRDLEFFLRGSAVLFTSSPHLQISLTSNQLVTRVAKSRNFAGFYVTIRFEAVFVLRNERCRIVFKSTVPPPRLVTQFLNIHDLLGCYVVSAVNCCLFGAS